MTLELSTADAQFLKQQLDRHLERVENELIHTDKRELQRVLAKDAERLRRIEEQIERLLAM